MGLEHGERRTGTLGRSDPIPDPLAYFLFTLCTPTQAVRRLFKSSRKGKERKDHMGTLRRRPLTPPTQQEKAAVASTASGGTLGALEVPHIRVLLSPVGKRGLRSLWLASLDHTTQLSGITLRTPGPDPALRLNTRAAPQWQGIPPIAVPIGGASCGPVEAARVLRSDRGCRPEGFSLSHSPYVNEALQRRSRVQGMLSSREESLPRSSKEMHLFVCWFTEHSQVTVDIWGVLMMCQAPFQTITCLHGPLILTSVRTERMSNLPMVTQGEAESEFQAGQPGSRVHVLTTISHEQEAPVKGET